ncbi:amidase [Phormidium tenue FACHB-886]|nr:amidase [Phormidium tenue FACHB-886]
MKNELFDATKGLQRIHSQTLSSEEWVEQCLKRIKERDEQVNAWEYLDAGYALQQARDRDSHQRHERLLGSLHGIPVGIKDIFATSDMPTQWGVSIYAGQYFNYDAAVVERLRAAGAVILGKTVTTEYASGIPSRTRNPRNLDHTPGASSSGSAAAVADGMVPIAIGSQTMGSVIRPASFCGVYGYKPSFGLVSRFGALCVSRELDHVGVFAHSVSDLVLLGSVLAGGDRRDSDCWVSGHLAPSDWVISPLLDLPKIALVRNPFWNLVEPEGQTTLLQVAQNLKDAGARVVEVELPAEFDAYFDYANCLMCAGLALNHGYDYERVGNQLSSKFRQLIERGRSLSAVDYAAARHATNFYNQRLSEILTQFDMILTPPATGMAPAGLENTGNPIFCVLWTLCGMPAVAIPTGTGDNGLPLAIQVVGARGQDIRLLNVANWIASIL